MRSVPPRGSGWVLESTNATDPPAAEAVKKLKWIAYTTQQAKLAGWEGGLAPAQDRMTLSLELKFKVRQFGDGHAGLS